MCYHMDGIHHQREEERELIKYRNGLDVIAKLGEAGFSTYRIRADKLLTEKALQKIRDGKLPSWHELDRLCSLLRCHPCDLLEYVPEPPGATIKPQHDTE